MLTTSLKQLIRSGITEDTGNKARQVKIIFCRIMKSVSMMTFSNRCLIPCQILFH